MRKTFCASVLVLALCGSAFAGDMGTPPAPACDIPNPPLAAEDINSPPSATQSSYDQTIDGFAEAALNVLDSMLALF